MEFPISFHVTTNVFVLICEFLICDFIIHCVTDIVFFPIITFAMLISLRVAYNVFSPILPFNTMYTCSMFIVCRVYSIYNYSMIVENGEYFG